jgi:hypothetical protein
VSRPTRADLLNEGGIYAVVVPLGWKLVGKAGEDLAIPAVPGQPFHRILVHGALLATEVAHTERPEVMTVRRQALPGPVTVGGLSSYIEVIMGALATKGLDPRVDEKRIGSCALSEEPCGRAIVSRTAPADGRLEIHYLVRDLKGLSWELTYLIRRANFDSWRPLLAEIDGPLLASTAPSTPSK